MTPLHERPLAGLRFMIVEDEWLVALELEEAIQDLGGDVTHIAGRLSDGMEAAEGMIDGALIDVNLKGELSIPIVEKLRARGIPFILTTGYDVGALPDSLKSSPRVGKPLHIPSLERAARQFFLH